MRSNLLRPIGFVLGLTLVSSAARADVATKWPSGFYSVAIRAAIRLSPAAEARLPIEYRNTIFDVAAEPDPIDPEPADEAQRSLTRLLSGKGLEKPYPRAQAIGRYLHFVIDCAAPQGLESGDVNANRTAIVPREPRALTAPIAEKLRQRQSERAVEMSDSAITSAIRAAVNLVADALLLLPARPGAEQARDEGPVVFFLDGTELMKSGKLRDVTLTDEEGRADDGLFTGAGEDAPFPWTVSNARGLWVAEWTRRRGTGSVLALLLNNDHRCATAITVTAGSFTAKVPGAISPYGFRIVELTGAPASLPAEVSGSFTPASCPEGATGISTARRLLITEAKALASFEAPERRVPAPKSAAAPPAPPAPAPKPKS